MSTAATCRVLAGTGEGLLEVPFDSSAGRVLEQRQHGRETAGGVFCALPDDGTVFVLGAGPAQPDGSVGAARALRRADDGGFVRAAEQPTQGNTPCYAAVNATGSLLAVANFRHAGGQDTRGSVAFLPLAAGLPQPVAQRFEPEGQGKVLPRQIAAHPHCVRFAASPDRALVADLGTDSVWEYPVGSDGRVADARRIAFPPGSGPRHLALVMNGHALLVVTEMGNRLHWLIPGAEQGWRELASASIVPPDASGGAAADVQVTSDGGFAYASLRDANTIAAFRLDPEAGSMELVGHFSCGGRGPRAFALSPDERWVIVANNESRELAFLPRDPATGSLAAAAEVLAIASGSLLAL